MESLPKEKSDKNKDEMSFEKSMEKLEQIVRRLEEGKDSLEECMALYEEGSRLKNYCSKKLKEAEGKWEILKKEKDENIKISDTEDKKISSMENSPSSEEEQSDMF